MRSAGRSVVMSDDGRASPLPLNWTYGEHIQCPAPSPSRTARAVRFGGPRIPARKRQLARCGGSNMRRFQVCLAVVVLLTALPLYAQSKAKVQNVPEIPFDSVANALKLPDNLYLGEGIGVATNSKGHVYVYTRSGATRLFEFDQTGAFVKEIGQGLYGFLFAHAVRVDKDDNIWAVDEGSNMVIKFDPNGKVLMLIGR